MVNGMFLAWAGMGHLKFTPKRTTKKPATISNDYGLSHSGQAVSRSLVSSDRHCSSIRPVAMFAV
jgi:hypothetical protein